MKYRIRFEWDSSFDTLLERVRYAIPELIVLNGNKLNGDNKR